MIFDYKGFRYKIMSHYESGERRYVVFTKQRHWLFWEKWKLLQTTEFNIGGNFTFPTISEPTFEEAQMEFRELVDRHLLKEQGYTEE